MKSIAEARRISSVSGRWSIHRLRGALMALTWLGVQMTSVTAVSGAGMIAGTGTGVTVGTGAGTLAGAATGITAGGGTTPGGHVLDRLEQAVKAPLPRVPPPQVSRPDQVWVPDRYLVRPDGVMVHVPPHWERTISTTEVYVPPLVACSLIGECVLIPAGSRLPVEIRQTP